MNADLVAWHAERDHIVAQRRRYREQPIGALASIGHCARAGAMLSPIMNIGAARLDRHGNAKRCAECDRNRAVGEEEFGIDHIKGETFAQALKFGQQATREQRDVTPGAKPWQMDKARPVDGQPLPDFGLSDSGEPGIAREPVKRRGRQAARRDDLEFDVGMRRKRACLQLDKRPEIGAARIGKQRG